MERSLLASAECYLFDMDGTLYLGDRLLPGASELIEYLTDQAIPYYFVTNNSSRSRLDYLEKLEKLGLHVDHNSVFTSGEATAIYLQHEKPGARLYLVGTPLLEAEFAGYGFKLKDDDPDYAVLGFDTTLTYDKLWRLCDLVREGVPYIATHPDINCPTADGFMPDIGSMMALVETSTGRKPDVIIGKPYPSMIESLVQKTGCPKEKMVMVGDRLNTDIAMGKAGIITVLVLSGEAQEADIPDAVHPPDLVVETLEHLLQYLRLMEQ